MAETGEQWRSDKGCCVTELWWSDEEGDVPSRIIDGGDECSIAGASATYGSVAVMMAPGAAVLVAAAASAAGEFDSAAVVADADAPTAAAAAADAAASAAFTANDTFVSSPESKFTNVE